MIEISFYRRVNGKSPFEEWMNALDDAASARIVVAVKRMREGNFSNCKSLGGGSNECKLNFGPGYRLYYGMEGREVVILLLGGTKSRQSHDIKTAGALWQEYKDSIQCR